MYEPIKDTFLTAKDVNRYAKLVALQKDANRP